MEGLAEGFKYSELSCLPYEKAFDRCRLALRLDCRRRLGRHILTESTPEAPAFGTFFYTWYGYQPDDWLPPKYVDNSTFGNYNSNNRTVINQQLEYIAGVGIDFVIISWQGFYDDYGTFRQCHQDYFRDSARNQ